MLSSGVISYQSAQDYAGIVEVFGKCYYDPDPEAYDAEQFFLMQYFDTESFNKQFLDKCLNKQDCKASLSLDPIAIPPQ